MPQGLRTERDGQLLILLRVPDYQGEKVDIPFTTIPLGIILTEQYLVTVCKVENDILERFSSGNVRGLSTAKRYRFILQILLATLLASLLFMKSFWRKVIGIFKKPSSSDQAEDQDAEKKDEEGK